MSACLSGAEVSPRIVSTACIRPSALPAVYTARIACDGRARQDAFRVRYASYRDGDFIEPNPRQTFQDHYDDSPTATSLVVYRRERPVASVRVCLLTAPAPGVAPAADTFGAEVAALLAHTPAGATGVRAAEINRLVRSPEVANDQGLVFLLFRLAGQILLANDVRLVLSCVRQNHVSFYRRLRFREVAGPRLYPGLRCPMHLMAGSRADYDVVRAVFPLMNPEALPGRAAREFLRGEAIAVSLLGTPGEAPK